MMKQNITPFILTQTIINESNIDDVFESIYKTIISNLQKYLENVLSGLLIQMYNKPVVFESTTP